MKNGWLMAMIAVLVLGAAACRKETKDKKAEQLAALESAYQSGVLSKGEYDAKKQALVGPPAAPASAPVTPATPPVAAPVTRPQAVAEPPKPVPQPSTAPSTPVPEQEPPAVQTRPTPQAGAEESDADPKPLAGCEDAEYRSGNAKGARQRFYLAPIEAVKRAADAALRSLDFNIHKEAGDEMEASKRRHISAVVGAGGERLTLHFERFRQGGQTGTLVTGETKKSFVGRVAQKSWTNAVLAQIACHLRDGR